MLARTETFRKAVSGAAPPGTRPSIVDVQFDNTPTVVGPDDVYNVAFPTGVAVGDRVYVVLLTAGTTIVSTITPPTAGTGNAFNEVLAATLSNNGGRQVRLAIWERVWTGDETGTIDVAATTGDSNTAAAFAVRNNRSDSNYLENATTPTAGADDPITAPTPITASNDNRLVVLVTGYGDDVGPFASFTGGTGADIPLVAENATAAGADRRLGVHAVALDTGSITGKSETTARTADSWICHAMVLRPEGS